MDGRAHREMQLYLYVRRAPNWCLPEPSQIFPKKYVFCILHRKKIDEIGRDIEFSVRNWGGYTAIWKSLICVVHLGRTCEAIPQNILLPICMHIYLPYYSVVWCSEILKKNVLKSRTDQLNYISRTRGTTIFGSFEKTQLLYVNRKTNASCVISKLSQNLYL